MGVTDRPLLFKPHRLSGLRRRGYDARSLRGGIAAWHAIGGRTVPIGRGGYDA